MVTRSTNNIGMGSTRSAVEDLLIASGVYLFNGGGLEKLQHFQVHISDYKIIVYEELSPNRLISTGNSLSKKKQSGGKIFSH